MKAETWTYLHDGGPFTSAIKLERLDYNKGYRLLITLSDATDYERVIMWLHYAFKKEAVDV